jgi:hypothetical protein
MEVNSNLSVDTNTLHVDSVAGRVGIGKTDPAYAMDVNGTVNATALYVDGSEFVSELWTESGSNIYYTGGNVGIGTTTAPQKTLEVTGPMRIADNESSVYDLSVETGTSWIFQSKFAGPDTAPGDFFGYRVSISGDGSYAIAASYGDSNYTGSAYIFSRSGSTWGYQSKITGPDAEQGDRFGKSVALSGDGSYALVGAYRHTDVVADQGSAYVFSRSGSSWTFQSEITAPDAAVGDRFGESVALSGDGSYAIVGARLDDDVASSSGAAYIFNRSGSSWTFQSKVTAPDPNPGGLHFLGCSVAISGDGSYAISGAYGASDYTGAAYIFSRSGSSWSYQSKITAPDAAQQDRFGWSVSMSSDGSYAIAGADRDDSTGSAYIFSRSGSSWSYQSKIRAPGVVTGDNFGYSVSISSDGSYAIAGAYGHDNIYYNTSGAAFTFSRSGSSWTYHSKIVAPDIANYQYLGYSVSISGDGSYAIVGAYRTGINDGSAYMYNLPGTLNVSGPIVADGTLLSFTGQHICFPEGPMGQGLVVSANKNKYVSLNGSLTTGTSAIKSSEALPVVSLSNVANDGSVFGVVDHFEQSGTTRSQTSGATVIKQDKESGDNRVIVNSLGEGAIWVANTNGNVVSGDFLTTSHLPGYAQRQEGHIFKSYTVAKSTMDCDFEPEDLPVQVILKDDDGNNILDSYGRLQWVGGDRTEPEYRIRYLDVSGTPTDEANAVHKAAYVGCTYHCG